MATLILRQIDDDLLRRLNERAAANGRLPEAEHRAILEAALRPKLSARDLWARLSRGERMELDFARSDADQVPRAATFD
jgi:plasmid stability protein